VADLIGPVNAVHQQLRFGSQVVQTFRVYAHPTNMQEILRFKNQIVFGRQEEASVESHGGHWWLSLGLRL
jgi:hypothetical protein